MKLFNFMTSGCVVCALLIALTSCVPASNTDLAAGEHSPQAATQEKAVSAMQNDIRSDQLPVSFARPAYTIPSYSPKNYASTPVSSFDQYDSMPFEPIGLSLSSKDKSIELREVLKTLATQKKMNIRWESDVNLDTLVDVLVHPEDDFFTTIENILQQRDYYYELEGRNTIVVKYKATKNFYIAVPATTTSYSMSVGGNVLGSETTGGNITGMIALQNGGETVDVWTAIEDNLKIILDIEAGTIEATITEATGTARAQQAAAPLTTQTAGQEGAPSTGVAAPQPTGAASVTVTAAKRIRKGYYTINRSIGLISVTAPPRLLSKVASYVDTLTKQLYRQISIEAKIIEVTLDKDNTTGINWSSLLEDMSVGFNFMMDFQRWNPNNPTYDRFITLSDKSFTLFLDAIKTQGTTDVLANPKISVMNGQPAMISIGENVTYIDSVTSSVDDGVITYSVNTSSVMSGLGMGVLATILNDDEVILNLTPVTSDLEQPIEYKSFGGANQVGLPVVNLREMSTVVRVKSGEMLVIGGLIDSNEASNETKVPIVGDIPGVGKLFKRDGVVKQRTELIIILQPKILS